MRIEPREPLEIRGLELAFRGVPYRDPISASVFPALALSENGSTLSLRDLRLHTDRLDDIAGPIAVHAELLTGWGKACAYRFRLQAGTRPLVEGRAGVFFIWQ